MVRKPWYPAPIPKGTAPKKVDGGYLSPSGVFYAARTKTEQTIARWLCALGHPPVPDCLRIEEQETKELRDPKVYFVGVSGNRYKCWLFGARSLAISLDHAIDSEWHLAVRGAADLAAEQLVRNQQEEKSSDYRQV